MFFGLRLEIVGFPASACVYVESSSIKAQPVNKLFSPAEPFVGRHERLCGENC